MVDFLRMHRSHITVVGLLSVSLSFWPSLSLHAQSLQLTDKKSSPATKFEEALARLNLGEDATYLEFSQIEGEGLDPGTELINGTVLGKDVMPAVFRATTDGTCTASMIGPTTSLLAAHCFETEVGFARFSIGGTSTQAICESDPTYAASSSHDWSLCLLEKPITGITFEAVNVEDLPSIGTRIILTGVGCTFDGEPPRARPLKAGVSSLVRRPANVANAVDRGAYIYTKSESGDGEAVLCLGDSGGPAFVFLGDTYAARRYIVGVNSRTSISNGVGLLSATASAAGRRFISGWIEKNEQVVCGINASTITRCMWRK
ncbi:trypsin-like serine protease [Meridianimarinicoccus sp. RP-17]